MLKIVLFFIQGKIPKNEYGNVEVFKPWMIPGGTIYLPGMVCLTTNPPPPLFPEPLPLYSSPLPYLTLAALDDDFPTLDLLSQHLM